MCVYSGHDALSGSFLISRRTIDLSRKEKILNDFRLQGQFKLCRIKIVVLDSIRRLEDFGFLKSRDRMKGFQLGIKGQGRGKTLQIILVRSPTLRLEEKLVRILVGKYPELVLDTGTITRPAAVYHSCEKGRLVKTASEYVVNLFIGMENVARHLRSSVLYRRQIGEEGELVRLLISWLTDQRIGIDG